MRVVPRIADDRDAFGIAWYVGVINTEQECRRIVALEQERVTDRAVAVQAFQVQLRRTRVPKRLRVDVALERRPIRGDVVRDELAEDRPAGRLLAKRGWRVDDIVAVAQSAGAAECEKKRPSAWNAGSSGNILAYLAGPIAASIDGRTRDGDKQCVLKDDVTATWTSDGAIVVIR